MKKLIAALMLVMTLAVGLVYGGQNSVYADDICSGNFSDDLKEAAGCNTTETAPNVVISIINIVLGIIAVVTVFVVVIGGITYVTSAGDPGKMSTSRSMVLYGVIGLVVALLAFAIVNFVSGAVFGE